MLVNITVLVVARSLMGSGQFRRTFTTLDQYVRRHLDLHLDPSSIALNATSTPPHPPADLLPRLIRRRFATTGRVRSGCLTCNKRKKKFDNQCGPSDEWCRSCVRLGLFCERLPLRTVTPQQQQKRKHDSGQYRQREERVRVGDTVAERHRSSRGSAGDRRKSCGSNEDNSYNTDDADDAPPLSWPPSQSVPAS